MGATLIVLLPLLAPFQYPRAGEPTQPKSGFAPAAAARRTVPLPGHCGVPHWTLDARHERFPDHRPSRRRTWLFARGISARAARAGTRPEPPRPRHLLGDVVGALLVQEFAHPSQEAADLGAAGDPGPR